MQLRFLKRAGIRYYTTMRKIDTRQSGARRQDVQLHMALELLNKLPSGAVHIELPVPLDVEYFSSELYYTSRVTPRKCVIPDVVIINPDTLEPSLIAEFRFTLVYWGSIISCVPSKKR